MTNFPFPGLNLAITTPFDDAGRIDYGRLEVNIERYLAAGVRSFLLSSGTGMHVYLSKAESEELVRRGAKIVNGCDGLRVARTSLPAPGEFSKNIICVRRPAITVSSARY
ncbi:dihydrodipicolinate synthetase-like domain-containing protein (plasmid) [Rhizobium phaseoli]|nr:dihydrodipicolinate synthetase-like domain-containing protein [Rhizobium phaseoli]ANL50203.1 dihydrodipicolinate synthetase-like domain-containing protein [Rhizobium phaseoli]ANM01245.1 dihydrodipicolinate synthetase-like domain-containing protein [Rhizobium phaseoli]